MITFKLSEEEVTFCKIFPEDGAIFVGTQQGHNYYIRMTEAEKESNDLNLFNFESYHLNLLNGHNGYNYITHCVYNYSEKDKLIDIFMMDNKGIFYQFNFIQSKQEETEPIVLSYLKSIDPYVDDNLINSNRSHELELALETPN